MGMSAWGFIITPVLAATNPNIDDAQRELDIAAYAQTVPQESLDIFDEMASLAGVSALDDAEMSSASGGAGMAIDIANLGVNIAENNGSVSGVTTTNSTSGDVSNNIVSDNSGITTVFNNSGTGVVMQSIVNMNIYLQGAAPGQ
ncbi:MAG: hypothetical protein DHS20C04_24010 [Hyphococcus sp.]|nr:MAG: hypothetical protein DHS20C04_24010 [Marinicaulis sp.]